MRTRLLVIILFSSILSAQDTNFIRGADMSFLHQVEEGGGLFTENGLEADPLQVFQSHGMNMIRLRIWHTPVDGINGLEQTVNMASRIKLAGMDLLLDFHYSDSWADPGTQTKPAAWQEIEFDVLEDSLYQYTFKVIDRLKSANALPDVVQLGNEIICGLLWNEGRVCDPFNNDFQWDRLATLLTAGKNAVVEAAGEEQNIEIMIHLDRGGDNGGAIWFYDNLLEQDFDFDLIGLSFYPWWHGTLDNLSNNLASLAARYQKEIVLVEFAYPWTLQWNDDTNNIIGLSSQLHTGYPATVDGQLSFISEFISRVAATPDGLGRGIVYWAPEWISSPGFGSAWENLALFNFAGELLTSISAFEPATAIGPAGSTGPLPAAVELNQNYPNPFNPMTDFGFRISDFRFVNIGIYDIGGRLVKTVVDREMTAGEYTASWDGSDNAGAQVASGVYLYRLSAGTLQQSRKMILLR